MGEFARADQAARFGEQRDVQREEIGLREHRVAADEFGVQALFHFGGGALGVVVDDAHAEALRSPGDGLADAAEAQNAQRLAPDVGAAELVEVPACPLAGARERVAFDQAARDGEQQRPGEVGGGFVEHAGRVAGGDFVARAGVEIDIVEADGDIGDDAQIRRGGEQFVVDFFREQADQRVFVRDAPQKFGARRAFGRGPEFGVEKFGEPLARSFKERVRGQEFGFAHARASSDSEPGRVAYLRASAEAFASRNACCARRRRLFFADEVAAAGGPMRAACTAPAGTSQRSPVR